MVRVGGGWDTLSHYLGEFEIINFSIKFDYTKLFNDFMFKQINMTPVAAKHLIVQAMRPN